MEDMCRVCLRSKKHWHDASQFISLFTSIGDQDKIFKKIMKLAAITIKRTDEFPKYICKRCLRNLETAYNFKVQCETSNQSLQDFLITDDIADDITDDITDDIPDDITDDIPDDVTDDITEINGNASDTDGVGEEVPLIVMQKRECPKKLKKDKNVFVQELCKKIASAKCLVSSIEEENELTEVKLEDDFVYFDEDIATEEIVSEIKTRRGRPKKSGQHTTDKPLFMCDQCGKSFKLMGSLKGHQQRHTGDRPFTCSTCGKSFYVINELRKHSYTHTGIKPYSCKYCDKRFTDWGSRFKHERCHRGERPYQCEMCPKTFSYSYVLNRHKLTHSGNKAFSCELCQKQFTLKYHLTNHNRKYHNEAKPPAKLAPEENSRSRIAIEESSLIIDQHIDDYVETSIATNQLLKIEEIKDFSPEKPQNRSSNVYQAREINCFNVLKIKKLNMEKEFAKAKS